MTVPIWRRTAGQRTHHDSETQARAHLLRDPRQRSALERDTCVPFRTEWRVELPLELCAALVRVWQVPRRVPRRLFVALLRYDDVCLAVVHACAWVNACDLLEQVRLGGRLARALAAP